MSRSKTSRKGIKASHKSKDLPNSGLKILKAVDREIHSKNKRTEEKKVHKRFLKEFTYTKDD